MKDTDMEMRQRQRGFSLTEVLIAVGTLAVGMLFVGGTFVLAVHFSVLSTEKTYAAAVLQEAEVKLNLLGWSAVDTSVGADKHRLAWIKLDDPNEYAYPSDPHEMAGKQYLWSALVPVLREEVSPVFIFVCRSPDSGQFPDKAGSTHYRHWPAPIAVKVEVTFGDAVITVPADQDYIRAGSLLVSDESGRVYRVARSLATPEKIAYELKDAWPDHSNKYGETDGEVTVWVVPPAKDSGKNPCISVVPGTIRR